LRGLTGSSGASSKQQPESLTVDRVTGSSGAGSRQQLVSMTFDGVNWFYWGWFHTTTGVYNHRWGLTGSSGVHSTQQPVSMTIAWFN